MWCGARLFCLDELCPHRLFYAVVLFCVMLCCKAMYHFRRLALCRKALSMKYLPSPRVALADHIDRNPEKNLLRGRVGRIHSWILNEGEESEEEGCDRWLKRPPKVVFVKFADATWRVKGLSPGVYRVQLARGTGGPAVYGASCPHLQLARLRGFPRHGERRNRGLPSWV